MFTRNALMARNRGLGGVCSQSRYAGLMCISRQLAITFGCTADGAHDFLVFISIGENFEPKDCE